MMVDSNCLAFDKQLPESGGSIHVCVLRLKMTSRRQDTTTEWGELETSSMA